MENNHKQVRQQDNFTIGCEAEYFRPHLVLVHTPGTEFSMGTEMPSGALFEGPANLHEAVKEHQYFLAQLRGACADVLTVRDVLLQDTVDAGNNIIEGEALAQLQKLAFESLQYTYDGINLGDRIRLEQERREVTATKHPEELVGIILRQPEFKIKYSTEGNTAFRTEYGIKPMYNLMFVRDHMITTDKGVVVGAMNSSQRMSEIVVIRAVLEKLGIPFVYDLADSGNHAAKLEGGDFIPCGKNSVGQSYALLGQGRRTTAAAIDELVVKNGHTIFGYDLVGVVKEPLQVQEEMHLDTYFCLVAPQKAMVLKDRVVPGRGNGTKIPQVDSYEQQRDGTYACSQRDIPFYAFLEMMGFKNQDLLKLPLEMQRNYGLNPLTLDENRIIGVDIRDKARLASLMKKSSSTDIIRLGEDYRARLQDFGILDVDSSLIPFTHLNQAYGGPHCITQVFSRCNYLRGN